jgi:electron transport complex protein RnfB
MKIMVDVEDIDALLPQTQCRMCGFDGCKPYADAVAAGRSGINRCPPGGDDTVRALARLTGIPYEPIDPACGGPMPPAIAVIDEAACIGCALCIQACPVDAIVGASKRMHTVIEAECTGCRLCINPCPVDCISMSFAAAAPPGSERRQRAIDYKARHAARLARLERESAERLAAERRREAEHKKRAAIERAMQGARERLRERQLKN